MKRNTPFFLVGAIGATLFAAAAPGQLSYSLTDLGTLPGKSISRPAGINNQAQVTGFTESHAFLWTSGVMLDLGTLPGGTISTGIGINDLGDAVGDSQYSPQGGAIRHATLWSSGSVTDLGILPSWGNYSRGNGINDSGLFKYCGGDDPVAGAQRERLLGPVCGPRTATGKDKHEERDS
ncbi:MAG: hypothetical protein M3Q86_07375 [Verrucomicrobiota bacterium]|nr:hypothetical protein [Verrucomicrobiota bacterium]